MRQKRMKADNSVRLYYLSYCIYIYMERAGHFTLLFGVPDGIRTHGLWSRSPTLYPAGLRVHAQRIIAQKQRYCNCKKRYIEETPDAGKAVSSGCININVEIVR